MLGESDRDFFKGVVKKKLNNLLGWCFISGVRSGKRASVSVEEHG